MMRQARRRSSPVAAAAGTLAIGVAVTASGCFSSEGSSEEQSSLCPESAAATHGAPSAPAAIALVDENRLERISLRRGRVDAERKLAGAGIPSSSSASAFLELPGQLLVQPRNSQLVLVLVRAGPGGRDEVLAVDPPTLKTRCRYPLERGVRYRGIAADSSGRIYAYGYREGSAPKMVAAVLTILEPGRRPRLVTETARPPNGDWLPYWGTVAPDGRHVALSYHGSNTTGADLLDTAGDGLRRRPSAGLGAGRVGEVHGSVEPYGAGFLATTGSGMVQVGWNGRIDRLPVRPRNVHLMDFALDASRGLAYVSSCGERPAIQRLDLAEMRVTAALSGRFCGLPLAVYEDRLLVMAASPVDEAGYPETPVGPLRVLDLLHPGPGVPVRGSGMPQDAIALSADD